MKHAIVTLLAALGLASSATVTASKQVDLAEFFEVLQTSPELAAAQANVRAAQANLAQATNPATLDAGFSTRAPEGALSDLSDTRLSVGVTAYPFAYGEPGDVIRLRTLELQQARLDLRRVQTQLEATALESAADLKVSRQALELARTAAKAAEASYTVSMLRQQRGAATAQEVRDADAGRQEAQNLLLSAEDNFDLAEATLTSLIGDRRLVNLPELRLPEGTPASLEDAERTVTAARIGREGAVRPFLPVARLDYSFDASSQSRISASIDSSTLAPRLGYSYDYDGYGESGDLTLSISATLSPEQFSNVTRLDETLHAAEASRQAATRDASLTEQQLRSTWAEADRSDKLARLILLNAERTLAEVQRREALGVANAIETQTAAVALAQAGFDLRDSSRAKFAALFDLYEFYGLPPSNLLAAPRLETQP